LDETSQPLDLRCTVQFTNLDNWPCPTTTFEFFMNIAPDNSSMSTLKNGTFDVTSIVVVPQNGTMQNLNIPFDPTPLMARVTEDSSEVVSWSVSAFTNVAYDGSGIAVPITRVAKMEVGRCKRVNPTLAVYVRQILMIIPFLFSVQT
jgi:hypothetical protein